MRRQRLKQSWSKSIGKKTFLDHSKTLRLWSVSRLRLLILYKLISVRGTFTSRSHIFDHVTLKYPGLILGSDVIRVGPFIWGTILSFCLFFSRRVSCHFDAHHVVNLCFQSRLWHYILTTNLTIVDCFLLLFSFSA